MARRGSSRRPIEGLDGGCSTIGDRNATATTSVFEHQP